MIGADDPPRENPSATRASHNQDLRTILTRHLGGQIVVGTHGNLLALVLNGMDSTFGFDFWRRLSFPDVYRLTFDDERLVAVDHLWRYPTV